MTGVTYKTPLTTSINNPRLRLLNALKNGERPITTFLTLPSVRTAQVISQTGVDGVIIDCEHGNLGDEAMHNAVAAVAGLGISPIIRIRGPAPDLIKRALDTGAHGIMVPQINTAEEASQVVKFSKFPPHGLRGQGSPFPGVAHGLTVPEYMKSANETLITFIQIETVEGLENVDSIAAVEGVDCIFIGPNDLAQALLGYVPARGDEPVFLEAIEKIIKAAKKHGKWVSRLSNSGALAKEHLEVYDTVCLSNEVKAILGWYGSELKMART